MSTPLVWSPYRTDRRIDRRARRITWPVKTATLEVLILVVCYLRVRDDIPGGPKKRGHSTFSQISRRLLKIRKWFFAHIKASVCRTWHIYTNFSNSFYSVAPSGEYWTIITNFVMQHQNSNKRFLTEVSVNGGVAVKTWYSVMVDTSSMFVELKSTTLVLWTWSRSRFCYFCIFTRATDLGRCAYIKLLCVSYYCSIFARWRHWIKWITKICVNMSCSAYTCLDVCKKSFTYLQ